MHGSWFDALLKTVRRLPWPRPLSFLVTTILVAIPLHVAEALEDPALLTIHPDLVIGAASLPLFLWVAVGLDGVARRALVRLRPALDPAVRPEEEIAADLGRTPASFANVALVLGVLGGVTSVTESPGNWGVDLAVPGPRLAAALALSVVTDVLLAGFLAHVVHQLRVVARTHRESVRVDLFHLEPLYAFSLLTAATGLALLGLTAGLIVSLSVTLGYFLLSGSTDIAVTVGIAGIAIACFVVPLLGLHDRISDEKARRMAEAHDTIARLVAEVRDRATTGDLDGAGRLKDAMLAAESSVAAISRISTWPWRTETLRGFVSAVVLPVILWLLFQGLSRALPE